MSKTTLAYTGGILDGDGCVGYDTYVRKNESIKIYPRIIITSSTSYNYICQLKETLDFQTQIYKYIKRSNPRAKTLYKLALSDKGSNVMRFIRLVKPYSKHKGERLEALKQALLDKNVEANLKKITEANRKFGRGNNGKKLNELRKRKMLGSESKSV